MLLYVPHFKNTSLCQPQLQNFDEKGYKFVNLFFKNFLNKTNWKLFSRSFNLLLSNFVDNSLKLKKSSIFIPRAFIAAITVLQYYGGVSCTRDSSFMSNDMVCFNRLFQTVSNHHH